MTTDIEPTKFDYNQLDRPQRAQLKGAATAIKAAIARTQNDILEIGRRLHEVRESLDHGTFLKWIDAEFAMSKSAAYRFMEVAEAFGKLPNLGNLVFEKSALYALSTASDEARDFAIAYAGDGELVTHALAKDIIAAHAPDASPPLPPVAENHPGLIDAAPADEPGEHTGSIPDERLPPYETEADRKPPAPPSAPTTPEPETPPTPRTLSERAAAAPIVHDTMPPAPPAGEQGPDENDLTDDEWLLTIPLYHYLVSSGDAALLLRADALSWRTLTQSKAISTFKHAAERACNFKQKPTPFTYLMFQATRVSHPREWGGCVKCRAAGCSICEYSQYTLHGGLTVAQLEARS